jgi:hypothetical protein
MALLPLAGLCGAAPSRNPAHFSVREIATRPQASSPQPLIVLPKPTGSHRVGRMALHVVDSTRREAMTADSTDFRELVVHVWYPTDDTAGTRASYFDVALEDSVIRRHYGFILDQLPRVRAHSFVSAGMSNTTRRYPVILFSHGLGLLSGFYTSFIEDLASHGFVVAGVEHTWFSGAYTLPDGRTVTNRSANADRQRDVVTQAEDLSLFVTVLETLNRAKPSTRLAGRLDLSHLGVFGHSRGGFASPHACRIDRRFKACLNLDGYSMTPAVMDSGITQPFMLVEEIAPWSPPPSDSALASSGMTRAQADSRAIADSIRRERTFEHMAGGAYIVVSPGAVHNSFTDLGIIAPARFPAARQDFHRTIEITRAYVLAFFDTYLRGRSSSLLTGKAAQYPEAWLTIYRPGKAKRVFPGAPTWDPGR